MPTIRIDNSEIKTTYFRQDFDKDPKNTQWGKVSLYTVGVGILGIFVQNNDSSLSSHIVYKNQANNKPEA